MSTKRGAITKIAAGLAVVAVASLAIGPVAQAQVNEKVIYVYDGDVATKDLFRNFVEANGYEFSGVRLHNADTFDYAKARLVLVASDAANADFSKVLDEATIEGMAELDAAVEAIDASGKPVLGIGRGGAVAHDTIVPSLGYYNAGGNGVGDTISQQRVGDRIWTQPQSLVIEEEVKVYQEPTTYTAVGRDASLPSIQVFGNSVEEPEYTFSPVAISEAEDGQNGFLWGFNGTPESMTKAGRKLFINSLERTITFATR